MAAAPSSRPTCAPGIAYALTGHHHSMTARRHHRHSSLRQRSAVQSSHSQAQMITSKSSKYINHYCKQQHCSRERRYATGRDPKSILKFKTPFSPFFQIPKSYAKEKNTMQLIIKSSKCTSSNIATGNAPRRAVPAIQTHPKRLHHRQGLTCFQGRHVSTTVYLVLLCSLLQTCKVGLRHPHCR